LPDVEIEHAERIVALEVKVDTLTRSVEALTNKVDELLGIVQQARGARYALVGFGAIAGAVVSWALGAAGKVSAIIGAVAR
jgi:hypothetical protein